MLSECATLIFISRGRQTKIRMNVALAEAQLSGKDIFEYNAESNGAKDVYHCTAQIIALAL